MSDSRFQFVEGIREAFPVMLAISFFGMLFGATGVNNGLSISETVLSSAAVFAGASQFVFLDLYGQQAPVWSVLLAVFALNFRHVLYSASIGRFMGTFNPWQKYPSFFLLCDPLFGAGERRAEKQSLTPSYYFGYGLLLYLMWLVYTFIGAYFGALITNPQALGFDMILSIYFLALLMDFRTRSNWLATVLTSGIVASIVYKTIGSPWHIMLGALAGILFAAMIGKPVKETTDD